MILWDLDYKTWRKLWHSYKLKPYEMTGDSSFTEAVIRSCRTDKELFFKFQWEYIDDQPSLFPELPYNPV